MKYKTLAIQEVKKELKELQNWISSSRSKASVKTTIGKLRAPVHRPVQRLIVTRNNS